MRQFTLELPGDLPVWNANSRGNHYQRATTVRRWRETVGWAARAARIPRLGRVDVELMLIPCNRRRRDPDNLAGALKPALDGIVDAGILDDDSSQHVASVTLRIATPRPALTAHRWLLSVWELPDDADETILPASELVDDLDGEGAA